MYFIKPEVVLCNVIAENVLGLGTIVEFKIFTVI